MSAAARGRRRTPELFLNRELSALAFQGRILEEAADTGVPLPERLRFAIIAASNLDEFFMVRVAALKHEALAGGAVPDDAGLPPGQQLTLVADRAHALVERLYALLHGELLPALAERGIRLLRYEDVDEARREPLRRLFRDEIAPALTPLAIDSSRPFPMLANLSLNLGLLLAASPDETAPRLGVVQVPGRLPRLQRVPGEEGTAFVWLEDLIRAELGSLFRGQEVLDAAVFRVARDSELDLDDEGGRDYRSDIEEELRKRLGSPAVRLEIDKRVGEPLLGILASRLAIGQEEIYRLPGPIDPRGLLPLAELPALDDARSPAVRPQPLPGLGAAASLFETLDERDLLLHHPYDSFEPVVALVQQAADDPDVLAVKQTLYRVSADSPIVAALTRAAAQGKQVTVVIEPLARFDEQSNLAWARRLEESGAHVIYGLRGLKTHAKICLVVRRGERGIRRYLHLGTGNYNDRTARVYTDMGLMTAERIIGQDASAVFNYLTGYSDPPQLKKLVMAPTSMRGRLLDLIRREQRRAEAGQAAAIHAKMNSLVDEEIIRALYDASQAGVEIRLNVRGICCLRPGLKGVSERIQVVSIVDRFLEHARVLRLRNGGDEEVWLSSADWMPRNLDRRIELMFPIEDADARRKVCAALDTLFADNVKSRWLQADGAWKRRRPGKGEEPLRAQERILADTRQAVERARAVAGDAVEPLREPPAA